MDIKHNGNGELETLKVKLSQVLDKLEQNSRSLQELQSEQESLAEWVRGLEQVIKQLPQPCDSSDDKPSVAGGGVVNHFQGCNVYISPVRHPVSEAPKG